MEDNMKKRIITSVIAICILLPILFFSNTIVLPVAAAIVNCIGLYEIYKCIGKHKEFYYSAPAFLFAIISPFIIRYIDNSGVYIFIAFISSVFYLLYLFMISVLKKGKVRFSEISEIFTLSAYIIAAFNSIIYIRDIDNSGKYLYLLIFIGSWVTDIFAYFTGMLFGKHKLIPAANFLNISSLFNSLKSSNT